jgi:tripartite-type tricarboxylate transporter receptor subunit TctC
VVVAARIIAAAFALALAVGVVAAQSGDDADGKTYPTRSMRIIVPFPPGGPADIVARFLAQKMSEDWAQGVGIDNRAGGNTAIGTQGR